MGYVRGEIASALRCAVCHGEPDSGAALGKCPACGTLAHADCALAGCPTLGCAKSAKALAFRARPAAPWTQQPPPQWTQQPPPWQAWTPPEVQHEDAGPPLTPAQQRIARRDFGADDAHGLGHGNSDF